MSARTKRIWTGLVNYANATAATIAVDEFRRTVADCMPWHVAAEWAGTGLGLLEQRDHVLEGAVNYQSSVQALLRWLSSAKPAETGDLFRQAYGFLYEHTQHINWRLIEIDLSKDHIEFLKELNYPPIDLDHFEQESDKNWAGFREGESPLGILTPAKGYEDLADPICDFLLTEYQKYRDREYSRKDKKPAPPVPIFVCPNCNKLVMPARVGRKKYCSDCSNQVRTQKYRQKASPDENRDYQWLYRLQHMEVALRKVRLRDLKVRERLEEVKARQRNSSRCQGLIQDMRL